MSDVASTDTPQRPSAPSRHYALFVSESQARLFWKLRDEGVTLSAEGISWHTNGTERTRTWNDVTGVNLATGYIHKQGTFYACTIVFRDGGVLIVRSVSAWGHKDEEREPVYRAFVETLHAKLAQPGYSAVQFVSGAGGNRTLGQIALVVAAIFFVGLPLVLIFIAPPLEALLLVAAGAAFVWPLWSLMQKNEPRTYSPRELPNELLP